MQKVKENKIFIILVLILSSICFFYINQKQGFHEDEIFSYGSSNYKYDNVFRSYGYAQANYAYLYTNLLQEVGFIGAADSVQQQSKEMSKTFLENAKSPECAMGDDA